MSTRLGGQQAFNVSLVLGLILLGFVLLVPKGIVPYATDLLRSFADRASSHEQRRARGLL